MSSNIRRVDLPEKDRPLREDVSLLGTLVGQMLVDQHGEGLLEHVERVRKASIRNREGDPAAADALEETLRALDHDSMRQLIHAFSTYLRAVNVAEKVHRIRRRRDYQRADDRPQPGGIQAVLEALSAQGHEPEAIAAALASMHIHPVFTAHPTEATRRTILEKEYDIVLRLVERLNPELTPAEEQLAVRRIRSSITSAWQTRMEPHARPTVADELDNILFYLTDILYRVVPVYHETLGEAVSATLGHGAGRAAPTLRFGSWVGGDMDGNPNVTANSFLETLAQQRASIIRRYLPEVRGLARYLSQSSSEVGISADVIERLERYRSDMPGVDRELPKRYRDMPYRCLLRFVESKLSETLNNGENGYAAAAEFAADIELIRDSLAANKGRHAGQFGVDRLLCRVENFGFHLVTLDVRQDALLHRQVMGELLGEAGWESRDAADRTQRLVTLLEDSRWPGAAAPEACSDEASEALAVFRAIAQARQTYGDNAVGMFIISMAQGADDVLTVLALNRIANHAGESAPALEVTPLLETVDDLDAGPEILQALLHQSVYRDHLDAMGKRQVIMVGYSDSSKDSGIVASRWSLHEAQRQLVRTGEAQGIDIAFFHGRGGTVTRGGGNLVNGILGAPPRTVGGYLRMTEQGEVINQKYGVRFIALRNLELVTGATLTHTLNTNATALDDEERGILDFMSQVSREKFRGMVYDDPGFPSFFRSMTPLDVIEQLNIGSRPASRRSGEGIENLRAIPWVFSWAQTRVGFPGVFGFGTALEAAMERFGTDRMRRLLDQRIFFQAMVSDVEMVLGKSELGLGRRYAALAGPGNEPYFEAIAEEFERATRHVLELKQIDELLDDQAVLQRNIRLRNPYVDPLHLLQIDLLRRWRAGGREDDSLLEALKGTVKGIALGIQNTG